jgi:hypothetical protein
MSAQDDTLDRYHGVMHVNAQAQILRVAREAGIFDRLGRGQATAEDLIDQLGLDARCTPLVLDALVAMRVLEKYGDDYALAAVTRLLCEFDQDLGNEYWEQLSRRLREPERAQESMVPASDSEHPYFDAATATQWWPRSTALLRNACRSWSATCRTGRGRSRKSKSTSSSRYTPN